MPAVHAVGVRRPCNAWLNLEIKGQGPGQMLPKNPNAAGVRSQCTDVVQCERRCLARLVASSFSLQLVVWSNNMLEQYLDFSYLLALLLSFEWTMGYIY
jgi:hypothetical protein